MDFDIAEWRKNYDLVQFKGQLLKDSRPSLDKNKRTVPPLIDLTHEQQMTLEDEIDVLLKKNNRYLDACNMKAPAPLWPYSKDDPKTWPSHDDFIYGHLLHKKAA